MHTPGNVPYPHRLIKTARSKEVGLMVKVEAKHKVGVSFQNLDRGTLMSTMFGKDKHPE